MPGRRTAAEEEIIVAPVFPDERAFFGLRRCRVERHLDRRGRYAQEVTPKIDLVQVTLLRVSVLFMCTPRGTYPERTYDEFSV